MFPMDTRTAKQIAADERIASFNFPAGTVVPDGVELREGTAWLFGSTAILDITEDHFEMSAEEMTETLNREVDDFFAACEE